MITLIQQARDILGVAPDSDPATVAHAYRRLARANHPDVSTEPDAAQRFATITAAYQLLRDHAMPTTPETAGGPIRADIDATPPPSPQESPGLNRRRPAARESFLGFVYDGARPFTRLGGRPAGLLDHATIVAGPVTVTPPRHGSSAGSAEKKDF